jgi:hypothetical protein
LEHWSTFMQECHAVSLSWNHTPSGTKFCLSVPALLFDYCDQLQRAFQLSVFLA